MARILVGTIPVGGHIIPMLPLVRALIARGHEVSWYSGNKYRATIEASGASFIPLTQARDYDDVHLEQAFPERVRLKGLAQVKFDMKHLFIDNAPGQMRDLETICAELKPALVLGDPGLLGAIFLHERGGPPAALLFVLPLVVGSVDAAPFGLGLGPSASPLGRLRNRALNFAVEHVLFRDVQMHWNATRKQVGLDPTGWWMNAVERVALCLQPTIPGFEYPRSDLPPNSHGVPLVVAGTTEDKAEVAARVAWSGAGLNLKSASPSPSSVREAVRRVLSEPTFRTRAQALAKEYTAYDALARATDLIEGITGA